MNFKPFCVSTEGLSFEEQDAILQKAIDAGAVLSESRFLGRTLVNSKYEYVGVTESGFTVFWDYVVDFGYGVVLLTPDEVDGHLNPPVETEMFCGVEYRKGFMTALTELSKEYKL